MLIVFFFFQAEDGIRDKLVTGVQTCALPISTPLPALEEPHPAIVGQDLWPPLHGRGRREHALEGGRDQDPVDGDHAATTRKPGRARATAPTPASRNRSLNSPTVYPRRSDSRASWRVWRRNPRP